MESFGISPKNKNSRRTTEKPFRASEDQTEMGLVENSPTLENLRGDFRKKFLGYFLANKKREKASEHMRALFDIFIKEEEKESAQMEQKIRNLEDKNRRLEDENQKMKTEMGKERQEHQEALQNKDKEIKFLNNRVFRIKEEIPEIKNHKNEISHLNGALQLAEQEIKRQEDENSQLRSKIQNQEEEIDNQNQEIESNILQMDSDREEIQQYKLIIEDQNEEITKLDDGMVFTHEKMVNDRRKFEEIIQRYKDDFNFSQKSFSELECQNEKLKAKLNFVREKMASDRQKHQAQLKEKNTYAEQLATQLLETQKMSAAINLEYQKLYLNAQNKLNLIESQENVGFYSDDSKVKQFGPSDDLSDDEYELGSFSSQ